MWGEGLMEEGWGMHTGVLPAYSWGYPGDG